MVAIMSLVLLILLWLRLWLLPLVQFFKSILFFRAVLGFNQNLQEGMENSHIFNTS